MNKKLLFGMFAASALFVTSCSEEELVPGHGKMTTVSFTVGVEDGALTRAISDGKSADMLVYAVFDHEGNRLDGIEQVVMEDVKFPTTVNITLAKGQKYNVVFWAQDADCNAYTIDNKMNVTIDYNNGANNDETRDAFFKSEHIEVGSNTESYQKEELGRKITLTRPFAQLNVGATKDDWDAAVKAGVEIAESEVIISNVANKINLLDGTVSGSQNVHYTLAALPNEDLMLDNDGDKVRETAYKYLSMSYLLVDDESTGDSKALISSLEFNFKPKAYNTINFKKGLQGIPVQRNWRTNIVGKILTSDVDFNISIDPNYNDDYNIDGTIYDASTTPEELVAMLKKGGKVVVDAEIENLDLSTMNLENDLELVVGKKVKNLVLGQNVTSASNVRDFTRTGEGTETTTPKYPNISVEILKNVDYPSITLTSVVKNHTIKGNVSTGNAMHTNFIHKNVTNIDNFTLDGIKAADGVVFDFFNNNCTISNLTIKNCDAYNVTKTFIKLNGVKNATIVNNKISYNTTTVSDDRYKHGIEIYNPTESLTVKGNYVESAKKHGLMLNGAAGVLATIENNIFNGAVEDGIKTDNSNNVSIIGNTIKASQFGVRVDRLNAGTATVVIKDNVISTPCDNDDMGNKTYGIKVDNRGKTEVKVNLTVENNKAGEYGIGKGQYFYAENTNMTLEGDHYSTPFIIADGVEMDSEGAYYISNANGLKWVRDNAQSGIFINKTIRLKNDINLTGEAWYPINAFNGTNETPMSGAIIDGNNKKIVGMNVKGEEKVGFIGACSSNITIQDLTFENPVIEGTKYVGTVIGYQSGKVEMKNVHITGGSLKSNAKRVGGMVGFIANEATNTLNLTNCSVKNTTIAAYQDLAGLVGSVLLDNQFTFEGCSSENNTFYYQENNLDTWNAFYCYDAKAPKTENVNSTSSGNKGISSIGVVDYKETKTVELSAKEHMFWFANYVNECGNTFSGMTVKMTANIDLKNEVWTPIGQTGKTLFLGVFDGKKNDNENYVISNLNIDNTDKSANCASGLFGWIEKQGTDIMVVKNVTVKGATVNGHHNVGVIAGYLIGTLENCHVENANLVCSHANDEACGDKCGVIAGIAAEKNAIIRNCSAARSNVKAGRDAGQIVGACIVGKVDGCSVTDVLVEVLEGCTGNNVKNEQIGRTN